jgi:hypothetical protein
MTASPLAHNNSGLISEDCEFNFGNANGGLGSADVMSGNDRGQKRADRMHWPFAHMAGA